MLRNLATNKPHSPSYPGWITGQVCARLHLLDVRLAVGVLSRGRARLIRVKARCYESGHRTDTSQALVIDEGIIKLNPAGLL